MDIAIPPPLVPAPSQGGTPPALKPGDVITAKVLQVLADGLARLSLANMIVDLPTEVMLTPGTTIQLAVGGTPENLKLALVDQSASVAKGAQVEAPASPSATGTNSPATAPRAASDPAAALSTALRGAAVRQNGLAPLFADLKAAAGADVLPEAVRQAAARILSFQVPAGTVSAADVKQAFARSGVFLEAQLAGAAQNGAAAAPTLPSGDLKAALLVFRHVLKTWIDGAPAAQPGTQPVSLPAQGQPGQQPGQPGISGAVKPAAAPAGAVQPAASAAPGPGAQAPAAGRHPGQAPPPLPGQLPELPVIPGRLSPTLPLPGIPAELIRPTGAPVVPEGMPLPEPGKTPASATAPGTQAAPEKPASAPNPLAPAAPPYRGGPLAPQPPAIPSVAAEADPHAVGERLLEETDAAISRQTLLQGASLPEGGTRARDAQQIRWNFEIPLATPQGTAVAQFEIARDGRGGNQASRSEPVWRVRFTLDVEPIGPVHAQIALAGGKTSVALWAERPASAVRLRHDAAQLSAALRDADLEPGDVLVRLGEPPRPPDNAAGRFVDRAS